MILQSITYEYLAKAQVRLCKEFECECVSPDPMSKVGIAWNTMDRVPLNGLRHPPQENINGWYLWGGEDFPCGDDAFSPLHALHLVDHKPEVIRFLGLPPGYRFLIAGGHVDVWFGPSLLHV